MWGWLHLHLAPRSGVRLPSRGRSYRASALGCALHSQLIRGCTALVRPLYSPLTLLMPHPRVQLSAVICIGADAGCSLSGAPRRPIAGRTAARALDGWRPPALAPSRIFFGRLSGIDAAALRWRHKGASTHTARVHSSGTPPIVSQLCCSPPHCRIRPCSRRVGVPVPPTLGQAA